jgi:hypothetical protein
MPKIEVNEEVFYALADPERLGRRVFHRYIL